MVQIQNSLSAEQLGSKIKRLFEASAQKINSLDRTWNASDGAPVFTVNGRYTSRGWTEWTQGFQFGAEILQFDGTGEKAYLAAGCEHTIAFMAPHVSHVGVHDHGFNNIS